MDKELINKVAEIYRERSVMDLTKAKEIIALCKEHYKCKNKEKMIDKIADYVVDYPRFEETAHEVAELIFDLFDE